jgi:hypothetical protein
VTILSRRKLSAEKDVHGRKIPCYALIIATQGWEQTRESPMDAGSDARGHAAVFFEFPVKIPDRRETAHRQHRGNG